MTKPRRVYMRELARLLDRSSHTIRGWERDGLLPRGLRPHRDEKDWRYWTPQQAERLQSWLTGNGMAPGKGLRGFSPSPERVQEMLGNLRQPRALELKRCPHCRTGFKNLSAHVRRAHPEALTTD